MGPFGCCFGRSKVLYDHSPTSVRSTVDRLTKRCSGDSMCEIAATALIIDCTYAEYERDQGKQVQVTHITSHLSPVDEHVPEAVLWRYLEQHGRGTLAISTLQEGMRHFLVPGLGYIAYGLSTGRASCQAASGKQRAVALGDPICEQQHYAALAGAFLRAFPAATFLMASASFATVLSSQFGMLVNSVGGETELDLTTYQFTGSAKRGLRSAISSAAKSGITIQEVMTAPLLPGCSSAAGRDAAAGCCTADWRLLSAEMDELDCEWEAKRGKHAGHVWFLNRSAVHRPERGVRKFIARDAAGQLQAYMFFDAVYDAGCVVGYYANVTRMRPGAHPGVLNLMVKEFIDRVRVESNLAAPTKKVSIKRSQRKKMQLQEAAQPLSPAAAAGAQQAAGEAGTGSPTSSSVRFLSLGLSPYHNMDDSLFPHSAAARKVFEFAFNHGSKVYPFPFDSLAAGKAKYGAGGCSSVTYKQVYLAHSYRTTLGILGGFADLGKMCGFFDSLGDAVLTSVGHKLKAAGNKIKSSINSGNH